MGKERYPEEFFQWLADNREKMDILFPTNPFWLEDFLYSGMGGYWPIIEWDLGQSQILEEMTLEELYIYIEKSLCKLWEEYCDEKRGVRKNALEFKVRVLDLDLKKNRFQEYFFNLPEGLHVVSFKELERLMEYEYALPTEAYRFKDWWLKQNHIYLDLWLSVGWRPIEVKLGEYVKFKREP